jgi:hypothetical protein
VRQGVVHTVPGLALVGLGLLLALVVAGASGQPDLAVSVVPTQDLPDGSSVPITVTLRNLGDVGIPGASVVLSVDGSPADPPLEFGLLGAGSSLSLDAAFTLGCGSHAITAVADPSGAVNESDESNNAATAIARVVPVPAFTMSVAHSNDGHTLTLDATGTTGCRPLAFAWTIVPGGALEGEVASRLVGSGPLNVTLTVTSLADATVRASATQSLNVSNNLPPWVQVALPGGAPPTGSPCGLVVNATDVDGTVASYLIDMGDGSTVTTPLAALSHAYGRPGTYAVVVTVTDNQGRSNQSFFDLPVGNRLPEGRVVSPMLNGTVGEPVTLSGALSTDPEDTALTYAWSFGDGQTAGGMTTEHAYGAPGEFVVTLTVTDEDGGTATATARVTVVPGASTAGVGPEVPALLAGTFVIAAALSFAFARSRPENGKKRVPPRVRAGSSDPPPPGVPEEE